ncbi:GIY-YIG nuclease family protein [Paenarthrobacter aurescens]|uniref:GIY-YIG nuclease family protein n=1 Tax=Paenarthrobacter aurescens TaxID=43663 RepID=UPI0034D205A1
MTPRKAGVYKWFLTGDLPVPFYWPDHFTPIVRDDLIYIGRANSLPTRAKHHKLQTSKSSLRRTLASLIGLPALWERSSAHPGIDAGHHALLTTWMTGNLAMSFSEIRAGEKLTDVEATLRNQFKAPLNKDNKTRNSAMRPRLARTGYPQPDHALRCCAHDE